jgi:hypothetical protein
MKTNLIRTFALVAAAFATAAAQTPPGSPEFLTQTTSWEEIRSVPM